MPSDSTSIGVSSTLTSGSAIGESSRSLAHHHKRPTRRADSEAGRFRDAARQTDEALHVGHESPPRRSAASGLPRRTRAAAASEGEVTLPRVRAGCLGAHAHRYRVDMCGAGRISAPTPHLGQGSTASAHGVRLARAGGGEWAYERSDRETRIDGELRCTLDRQIRRPQAGAGSGRQSWTPRSSDGATSRGGMAGAKATEVAGVHPGALSHLSGCPTGREVGAISDHEEPTRRLLELALASEARRACYPPG